MQQVFDIIEAINEKVVEFLKRAGVTPSSIAISAGSYRRLLEMAACDASIGNLIIGCRPLQEIETPLGKLRVIIDELFSDTEIEVTSELAGAV
jgi:hypothetical protein